MAKDEHIMNMPPNAKHIPLSDPDALMLTLRLVKVDVLNIRYYIESDH